MEIKELIEKAHKNSKEHGFWDDYRKILLLNIDKDFKKDLINNAISTRIALIQSEASEVLEGLRNDDKDNFKEEFADIIIRTCDLAGGLCIDLEAEILKKMKTNKDRPYKHGKKF